MKTKRVKINKIGLNLPPFRRNPQTSSDSQFLRRFAHKFAAQTVPTVLLTVTPGKQDGKRRNGADNRRIGAENVDLTRNFSIWRKRLLIWRERLLIWREKCRFGVKNADLAWNFLF